MEQSADQHPEQPMKPDFLPDQYWNGQQADIQSLVSDLQTTQQMAQKHRLALSVKGQEVPSDVSGYDFSNLPVSEEDRLAVANFAYKIGLSKFQAQQLFGDEAQQLSARWEEKAAAAEAMEYEREQSQAASEREAFIKSEVEKFGGVDKVRDLDARMNRMFTGMKNRGLIDDQTIAEFKETAMTNSNSLKAMNSILGYVESQGSIQAMPAVNQTTGSSSQNSAMAAQFQGLTRDQITQKMMGMLSQAKSKSEQDAMINQFDFLGGLPKNAPGFMQ